MLVYKFAIMADSNNHANLEVKGIAYMDDYGYPHKFQTLEGIDLTHLLNRKYGAASLYIL